MLVYESDQGIISRQAQRRESAAKDICLRRKDRSVSYGFGFGCALRNPRHVKSTGCLSDIYVQSAHHRRHG